MEETFIDFPQSAASSDTQIDNAENLADDMKKLEEYIEYAKQAWVGNAADIFVNRLNDYVMELNTCSTLFKEDGETLEKCSNTYKNLEKHFLEKDI